MLIFFPEALEALKENSESADFFLKRNYGGESFPAWTLRKREWLQFTNTLVAGRAHPRARVAVNLDKLNGEIAWMVFG
jgi:hypothetical protein